MPCAFAYPNPQTQCSNLNYINAQPTTCPHPSHHTSQFHSSPSPLPLTKTRLLYQKKRTPGRHSTLSRPPPTTRTRGGQPHCSPTPTAEKAPAPTKARAVALCTTAPIRRPQPLEFTVKACNGATKAPLSSRDLLLPFSFCSSLTCMLHAASLCSTVHSAFFSVPSIAVALFAF